MYWNEKLDVFSDFLPFSIHKKFMDDFNSLINPWEYGFDPNDQQYFYYHPTEKIFQKEVPLALKTIANNYFPTQIIEMMEVQLDNNLLNQLTDCSDYRCCESSQNTFSQMGTTFERSIRVIFNNSANLKKSDFGNRLKKQTGTTLEDFRELDGIFEVLTENFDFHDIFQNKIEPWKFEFLDQKTSNDKNRKKMILVEVKCSPLLTEVVEFLKKVHFYCGKIQEASEGINFDFIFCYIYNSKDTKEFVQQLESHKPVFASEINNLKNFAISSNFTLICIHVLQYEGISSLEKIIEVERKEMIKVKNDLEKRIEVEKEEKKEMIKVKNEEIKAKNEEIVKLAVSFCRDFGITDIFQIANSIKKKGYDIPIEELEKIMNEH